MRGLYPLCLIPGTRRVVRAAPLPREWRLPSRGASQPVGGCSPSSPVLSCGTEHPHLLQKVKKRSGFRGLLFA